MAKATKIQWCDHTFNPWIGCTKVSEGCKNCYAEVSTRARVLRSRGQETWGKGARRERTSAAYWKEPLRWERDHLAFQEAYSMVEGTVHRGTVREIEALQMSQHDLVCVGPARQRVFCASLADWLDDEVPIEWLADLLALIHATPHLDWLLLTKRPQNWEKRLQDTLGHAGAGDVGLTERWLMGEAPPNVWIGTTVENQERVLERIPWLISIPAVVRFVSCEPLLGRVDLWSMAGIHWVIMGGESGAMNRVRESEVEWFLSLREQCWAADVACFMKQTGVMMVMQRDEKGFTTLKTHDRKGGNPEEWPLRLQVREFPAVTWS